MRVNLVISAAHLAVPGRHSEILTVGFLGSCIICVPGRPLPSQRHRLCGNEVTVGPCGSGAMEESTNVTSKGWRTL